MSIDAPTQEAEAKVRQEGGVEEGRKIVSKQAKGKRARRGHEGRERVRNLRPAPAIYLVNSKPNWATADPIS